MRTDNLGRTYVGKRAEGNNMAGMYIIASIFIIKVFIAAGAIFFVKLLILNSDSAFAVVSAFMGLLACLASYLFISNINLHRHEPRQNI